MVKLSRKRHSKRLARAGWITALLFSCSTPILAAEDELGAWIIVSGNDPIRINGEPTPWRFAFDAQNRHVEDTVGFRQYLLRPSVGYTLDSGVQVWFGFGRFETEPANGRARFENRYWQQLNLKLGNFGGGTLSGRLRVEERLLSTGDDTAVVARVMLRYTKPFGNARGQYWAFGVEPFIDFRDTDWGAEEGVSQNRVTLGIGRTVSEHLSVEMGYMNQYFFRQTRQDRSNHLATVNFRMNF